MFPMSRIKERQQEIARLQARQQEIAKMKAEEAWITNALEKVKRQKEGLLLEREVLEGAKATLKYLRSAPRTPGTIRERYAIMRKELTKWLPAEDAPDAAPADESGAPAAGEPAASAPDDVPVATDAEMNNVEEDVPPRARGKAKMRRPRKKARRT